MKFVYSEPGYPQIIEGMCRWASPRIGDSYDPAQTTGIAVHCEHGRAVVLYTHYEPNIDIRMHVAGEGHWINRTALGIFFGYPFEVLGLRRVTALVERKNQKVRRFDEWLGFHVEGMVRKAALNGDHLVLMGMLKSECRWLRGDNHVDEAPSQAA